MKLCKKVTIAIALLAPLGANAAILEADALISGDNVHFIDGPVSVNASFSDVSPASSTDPVFISESASIRGVGRTGTSLGGVVVNGSDNGQFNISTRGQANHFNESRFRLTETITNSSSIAQLFSMSFEISAGMLRTSVSEVPPTVGEFLQSEYSISISFNGASLFESGAVLRQVGAGDGVNTIESLTLSGTSLGGLLTNPNTGAPDTFEYQWGDFLGTLDLGVLGAGESGILMYDILTRTSGQFDQCGSSGCGQTNASIGDPINVSSIGFPDDITSTPIADSPSPVPVPPAFLLMFTGLVGVFLTARRKHQE
jgi:hypothetical protein